MNSYSYIPYIFSAVIFLLSLRSTRAAHTCHPDDEAGLLAFKLAITRDPLGILNQWKKGTNCCTWMGVTCITDDRVGALMITDCTVLGPNFILPSLQKLQHLEEIYFTSLHNFTKSFPQFLFQIPKLKHVDLSNIHLSGPLPDNIGALSQLEVLNLNDNQFTGPIPSSISNLTRLNFLSLARNRIFGTIPDIFKSMTQLISLDLSSNRFSGKLLPSLAALAPSLIRLDLSQNNLSGTIPNYFSRFKVLYSLSLSKNQFSGVVPKSFANMTKLTQLDLSHNLLTGPFPVLTNNIDTLDLSYNHFDLKTIPTWITSLPSIDSLYLAKCGIKISLDDWKPERTANISYIDLSENEISGSPIWFLNQAEMLLEFKASGNKLRFDMEKLKLGKSLMRFDLSRNLIFGKVQAATLAAVEAMNLSHNHLCGKLPAIATNFQASAFAGNDCLCGSPLSPCKT